MQSPDTDTVPESSPRTSAGWYMPKRILVGTQTRQRPQPGELLVPCIKLRGMWMSEAGIAPGTRLKVEIYDGAILLRVAEPSVSVELRPVRRTRRRLRAAR